MSLDDVKSKRQNNKPTSPKDATKPKAAAKSAAPKAKSKNQPAEDKKKPMTQAEMDAFFAAPLPSGNSPPTKPEETKEEVPKMEDEIPAKMEDKKEAAPEKPASPAAKLEVPAKAGKEDWESDNDESGSPTPKAAKAVEAEKEVEEEAVSPDTTASAKDVKEKTDTPTEKETTPEKSPQDSPEDSPAEEEESEAVSKKKQPGGTLKDPDPRPHSNIVFIGHVDAGKSTTCGNILYLTGYVDDRMIEKYQREAKEKNRDSWFLAYIMDTSEEEKAKGKTVEVGRAQFTTENKRFTILDAPGHKSYVPNMISGASQADIGVLIISARKGEFETGFEKGGQTSEHAILAKTLGVDKLIIAVNKMDDPSVYSFFLCFCDTMVTASPHFVMTSIEPG